MSLTPLNFNSNGKPEPSEDNTITLREYTGGPIAQFDAEQNFINFKGRVNDLLNSVSNLTSTVSSNKSSLETQISDLSAKIGSHTEGNYLPSATVWGTIYNVDMKASLIDTTLQEQITELSNTLSADIQTESLVVSGATSTGELTVAKTLKLTSGNSEATFVANDDYEALTIKPRSGTEKGSLLIQNSDLEVGGDAQVEGDLNIQGQLKGNGAIIGAGGLTSPLSNALVQEGTSTKQIEVAMGLRGAPEVANWGIFTVNMIGSSYPTHEVWVYSGANFTSPNLVVKNSSDKSQDMTAQFMAPIINGKCMIQNKELSSDSWAMYCMGWL